MQRFATVGRKIVAMQGFVGPGQRPLAITLEVRHDRSSLTLIEFSELHSNYPMSVPMRANDTYVLSRFPEQLSAQSAGMMRGKYATAGCCVLLLCLALTVLPAGASETPRSVRFDETPAAHLDFELKDARSQEERLSFVKEDDGDTVIRFGDDAITPNVVSLLQRELQMQLGPKLAGRRVVATSISVCIWMSGSKGRTDPVYVYMPGRPGGSAFGNAIAQPLAAVLDSMRDRKTVVVNVEGEVDEMSFSANVANKFSWTHLKEEDIRDAIAEATRKAAKDAGRWLQYRYAPTVPENYVGPKARIRDTVIGEMGPHFQQFFYLSKVNGQPANNSFDIAQRRIETLGHFEPPEPLEREVPAGPVKLEIVGRAGRGSNPKFDEGALGIVEFVAEEGKSYAVQGTATDDMESVWIVEQGTGSVLGEKFSRKR